MDVHLRDLRYFVAVAEELHFRRAAERLYISQPALSRRIAKLESDLDVVLIERDRRSVRLTRAGTELLDRARPLLAEWDEIVQHVNEVAASDDRVLRIGIQTRVGRGVIRRLQDEISSRDPGWRLDLTAVEWDDATVGLADRRVDVAIGWLPIPRRDDYRVAVVAREPRLVAVPGDHALAERPTVTFSDIEHEAFVALPESAGSLRGFWLAEEQRSAPANVALTASNAEETLEAVASGLGVALISEGNAALYGRDAVRTIPVSDLPPAELVLIARRDDRRGIIEQLFSTDATTLDE